MQASKLFWAILPFIAVSEVTNAQKASITFVGQVSTSCRIGISNSGEFQSVSRSNTPIELSEIATSSIGATFLEVDRAVAVSRSGEQIKLPNDALTLHSPTSRRDSRPLNGTPRLRLTERNGRVTVLLTPEGQRTLKSGAYRFEISARCVTD